ADALGAERMMRRRGTGLVRLPLRRFDRGGYQVVDETPAPDVADLVVGDFFEEGRREPHRQPTVDLPLDDHRVDDVAAVGDGDEPTDLHLARPLVDDHAADLAPERVGEV